MVCLHANGGGRGEYRSLKGTWLTRMCYNYLFFHNSILVPGSRKTKGDSIFPAIIFERLANSSCLISKHVSLGKGCSVLLYSRVFFLLFPSSKCTRCTCVAKLNCTNSWLSTATSCSVYVAVQGNMNCGWFNSNITVFFILMLYTTAYKKAEQKSLKNKLSWG